MTERDEELRSVIRDGDGGIAIIGARGKVKLVSEVVLLTSAYQLGRRDQLAADLATIRTHEHLDENARAEATAALEANR